MSDFCIRPLEGFDKEAVSQFVVQRWGTDFVVGHNTIFKPSDFPGFVAYNKKDKNDWWGLLTYRLESSECEIITIDSLYPSIGIGSLLLEAVKEIATVAGCHRIWLVTTNDNLDALRFYQRRGFVLVTIRRREIERSRQLKPEIPLIGAYGIPIRDEIELEMLLPGKF